MAQNDKKLCLSYSLSQEPHMIVVFGTHMLNDDISSNFFHFFKIQIFWVSRGGGKRAKNDP